MNGPKDTQSPARRRKVTVLNSVHGTVLAGRTPLLGSLEDGIEYAAMVF